MVKFLDKLSTLFTRTLENIFYRLGFTVATYPWWTILVSSIICLSTMTGLIWFHQTTDYEVLWAPDNTNALQNKLWIEKNYPKDSRLEYIILEAPNVLTKENIIYLFKIDQKLRNVVSSTYNKTYADLCYRTPQKCVSQSILQIWANKESIPDEDIIMGLDSNTIFKDVTKAWNEGSLGLDLLINEPEWNDNGKTIIGAKGFLSIWLMKNNASDYVEGDLPRDWVAEDWEKNLIKFLTDGTDHQPNLENASNDAMVYSFTERSFQDEIVTSIDGGMYVFGVGFLLILIYSLLVTSDFHPVNQRVMLLLLGFMVIGMAIGSSFGLGFHIGIIYADLHPIIPFLLLGIGVDDLFIIIKSTDNLSQKEKELPLKERIALVVQHSGVSITVTSLTDLVAFLISSTTSIPLLRAFCLSVALGISFLYFFVVTFFIAWYTLDERRIEEGKAFLWFTKRVHSVPPKKSTWTHNLYKKYYVEYLFAIPSQLILGGISLLVFGFGIFGTFNIQQDYDPITYMRQNSYQVKFIEAKNRLYPEFGDIVDIYVGNIPYWENIQEMKQIDSLVNNCQYVRTGSHSLYWFKHVIDVCESEGFNCSTEFDFKKAIVFSLVLKPFIFADLKLNITILEEFQDFQDLKWHIQSSKSTFQYGHLESISVQTKAMDEIILGLEKIIFEDSDFVSPISRSLAFHQWTANKVISKELIRNMSLNFACITIVLFMLLANIQLSLIVLFTVAMTITEIAGFAYFVGLNIEIVTSLELILSVGLVLDYSAHIGVCYTIQKTGSRRERSQRALLDMGPAIFSGGFSTFLAFVVLFFNDSYIFTSFCHMLGFGVLFGLWNALVFMPLLLSYFGPLTEEELKTVSPTPSVGRVNMAFPCSNSDIAPPMEEKKKHFVEVISSDGSNEYVAKF
ncbi:patched domain-containing protein 3 isoform X2 [Lepeophtheirus salmonis]|uniref:patched domain-containing protein 3 isoform X2 n=1 Tax=Lepeophtheirus salmonis TaxID=72036 RepID=UPI001AE2DD86|nr:NPC intracellular cholesterol transporter 1-like isoform X2 [Lepeophtheirus salmonis]